MAKKRENHAVLRTYFCVLSFMSNKNVLQMFWKKKLFYCRQKSYMNDFAVLKYFFLLFAHIYVRKNCLSNCHHISLSRNQEKLFVVIVTFSVVFFVVYMFVIEKKLQPKMITYRSSPPEVVL